MYYVLNIIKIVLMQTSFGLRVDIDSEFTEIFVKCCHFLWVSVCTLILGS